jgi:lipoprotein-anchoring transpeptidase ErfK/SrfK
MEGTPPAIADHASQRTALPIMNLRAVILVVAAPLSACNPASTEVPQPVLGAALASFAGNQQVSRDVGSRKPALAREIVTYQGDEPAGTVVIRTNERRLYLVLEDGKALRYPVGVGRAGKQWQGQAQIDGAHVEPAWAPTPEIKDDNPDLPDVIPGGSPRNPMGARALTLTGGDYAIHGTNRPESIGTYASYGCVRMFNEDIIDLFGRVGLGTRVVVTL